jgi:transposase
VSADAADWISDVVTQRCPTAIRCADPFHVVAWATEALDAERRRAWNDALAPKAAAERATRPAEGRRLLPPQPSRPRSRQRAKAQWQLRR